MDDYMDFGADDYFDTHDVDDLMEWETEQVFRDDCAEREALDGQCDDDDEDDDDE